jgi:hypothetical protein
MMNVLFPAAVVSELFISSFVAVSYMRTLKPDAAVCLRIGAILNEFAFVALNAAEEAFRAMLLAP